MRASFFTFACLALVACSGSSSSDVLGPNGTPASSSSSSSSSSGSTSTDQDDTTPPDDDLPPSTNPPKDDPPSKPPPTTSPPATAADCDSFAATYCAKADACDALLSKLLSTTDCADRVANICKARLAAPGTGFTTANLTACGNAYGAAATCADAFGAAQITACSMKGSLALNAKCAFADQCASGFCTGEQDNTCGTCAPAPAMPSTTYAGLGESCDFGGAGPQCNSNLGLWCDSGTKKCEEMTFVGLGQSCGFIGTDLVMCGPGGTCKWGTGGTGTCLAQKAIGASCTAASGYEECAFGSACIGGTCAYPTAAAICK